MLNKVIKEGIDLDGCKYQVLDDGYVVFPDEMVDLKERGELYVHMGYEERNNAYYESDFVYEPRYWFANNHPDKFEFAGYKKYHTLKEYLEEQEEYEKWDEM